jgi:hypothetical protein
MACNSHKTCIITIADLKRVSEASFLVIWIWTVILTGRFRVQAVEYEGTLKAKLVIARKVYLLEKDKVLKSADFGTFFDENKVRRRLLGASLEQRSGPRAKLGACYGATFVSNRDQGRLTGSA